MQVLLFFANAFWHESMLMQAVPNCAEAALHVFVRMQTLAFHINTKWYKSMLLHVRLDGTVETSSCMDRHIYRSTAACNSLHN